MAPKINFHTNFIRTDADLSSEELKAWAKLKRKVKHGPKLTRKRRAQYVLEEVRRAGLSSLGATTAGRVQP